MKGCRYILAPKRERDLECTVVQTKATAVLTHSRLLKIAGQCLSMKCRRHLLVTTGKWELKAWWQLQGTPARAKPLGIPGAWAETCGKGMHLQSPVTKSSVLASGCMCQLSPTRGSNNQDYVQRKGNVEPTVRRSHLFSSLLTFTKMSDQWRGLSQILQTDHEAPNPRGCGVG